MTIDFENPPSSLEDVILKKVGEIIVNESGMDIWRSGQEVHSRAVRLAGTFAIKASIPLSFVWATPLVCYFHPGQMR